jgi:ferritin
MLDKRIEKALNEQLLREGYSSQLYLAMASWTEQQGLEGSADFLFLHSDEERQHMLKLLKYINERGGVAEIAAMDSPPASYSSLTEMFQSLYEHEVMITEKINEIVQLCLELRDYTTHNFLQWFVSEQLEEEALARKVLDKINLIGNDKGGLYLFDNDISKMTADSVSMQN